MGQLYFSEGSYATLKFVYDNGFPIQGTYEERDQIGLLLKGFGNKFSYKSGPKYLLTFGLY